MVQEQPIRFERPVADIIVNGQVLDKDALAQEVQLHSAKSFEQARQRAARSLIIRQLLCEQVKDQLESGADEETAIAALIEKQTKTVSVDDEACERFYQQNPERFQTPPLMVVRHILLAVAKDDIAGRAEQKALADKLLADIQTADNTRAAFIAQTPQSRCPSKSDGGLLGELSSGQTVPEFERQVFMLDEGLASQPIETRYGYHLVYIDKKQLGQLMTFDMSIDKIRAYLNERRQRQAVSQYLHQLVENAKISGITLAMEQENIVL